MAQACTGQMDASNTVSNKFRDDDMPAKWTQLSETLDNYPAERQKMKQQRSIVSHFRFLLFFHQISINFKSKKTYGCSRILMSVLSENSQHIHGQIWPVCDDKWRLKCRQKHHKHVLHSADTNTARTRTRIRFKCLNFRCCVWFLSKCCLSNIVTSFLSIFLSPHPRCSFGASVSLGCIVLASSSMHWNWFFFLFCKWFCASRRFPQNWLLQLFVLIYSLMSA